MKPTDFSYYLTKFLTEYLPSERGASINTISSYRDTFMLFLVYLKNKKKLPAHKVELSMITKETILSFLDYLEKERNCCVSTRNVRLAAIHSLFRYMQYSNPDFINRWQNILAIPVKRTERKTPCYMSLDAVKLLLQMPNQSSFSGRRDLAMLSLMFDTGARVSEIINLTPEMVRIKNPSTIKIIGKGNKARIIPLLSQQTVILERYMIENKLTEVYANKYPLFRNSRGEKLTRQGVTYILKKYLKQARECDAPESHLIPNNFSCHSLRHSRAMSMLAADINLVYIRDLLGHASIKTTELYARADSKKKREAIEKAYSNTASLDSALWVSDNDMIAWLRSLTI